MDSYLLSADALLDIDSIWIYLSRKESVVLADRISSELFKAFAKIGALPEIGHRRVELARRDVVFYRVYSYLKVYRRDSVPVEIQGIIHAKRNIRRILKQRA